MPGMDISCGDFLGELDISLMVFSGSMWWYFQNKIW